MQSLRAFTDAELHEVIAAVDMELDNVRPSYDRRALYRERHYITSELARRKARGTLAPAYADA